MVKQKKVIEKSEKRKKYKKIILSLLMAFLIIISCIGCIKKKTDDTYMSEGVTTTSSASDITSSASNIANATYETTDTPDLVSLNSKSEQVSSDDTLEIDVYNFQGGGFFEYLVCDSNTRVIYLYSTYGGFTPYLSENGNYCRYVDGKIVEIEK